MKRRRKNPLRLPNVDALPWVGSEKQIAWAKRIWVARMPDMTKYEAELQAHYDQCNRRADTWQSSYGKRQSAQTGSVNLFLLLEACKIVPFIYDAKFWIDGRDASAVEIVNEAKRRKAAGWLRYERSNPPLGNTGWEFKQQRARKHLVDAVGQVNGNVDAVDFMIEKAFQFARENIQKQQHRIIPAKDWPALRVEATLALAKMVASGELRR